MLLESCLRKDDFLRLRGMGFNGLQVQTSKSDPFKAACLSHTMQHRSKVVLFQHRYRPHAKQRRMLQMPLHTVRAQIRAPWSVPEVTFFDDLGTRPAKAVTALQPPPSV